jgi:hypothetical protein
MRLLSTEPIAGSRLILWDPAQGFSTSAGISSGEVDNAGTDHFIGRSMRPLDYCFLMFRVVPASATLPTGVRLATCAEQSSMRGTFKRLNRELIAWTRFTLMQVLARVEWCQRITGNKVEAF